MYKTIQTQEEHFIQFSDEELQELGMVKGQKFSVDYRDDNSIMLTPFVDLEIDLSQFERSALELLISLSCEKDMTISEVISELLEEFIKRNEEQL